jgi:hypothetical protein
MDIISKADMVAITDYKIYEKDNKIYEIMIVSYLDDNNPTYEIISRESLDRQTRHRINTTINILRIDSGIHSDDILNQAYDDNFSEIEQNWKRILNLNPNRITTSSPSKPYNLFDLRWEHYDPQGSKVLKPGKKKSKGKKSKSKKSKGKKYKGRKSKKSRK